MADGTEPNLPNDSDNDGILDYIDLVIMMEYMM